MPKGKSERPGGYQDLYARIIGRREENIPAFEIAAELEIPLNRVYWVARKFGVPFDKTLRRRPVRPNPEKVRRNLSILQAAEDHPDWSLHRIAESHAVSRETVYNQVGPRRTKQDFEERRRRILELRQDPEYTPSRIAEDVGCSTWSVNRELRRAGQAYPTWAKPPTGRRQRPNLTPAEKARILELRRDPDFRNAQQIADCLGFSIGPVRRVLQQAGQAYQQGGGGERNTRRRR